MDLQKIEQSEEWNNLKHNSTTPHAEVKYVLKPCTSRNIIHKQICSVLLVLSVAILV